MYDSDEVRDAVRREMRGMMFTPGAAGLPAEELAAIGEARAAFGRELQTALVEYGRRRS